MNLGASLVEYTRPGRGPSDFRNQDYSVKTVAQHRTEYVASG